jgi:glycosyltransferase involved in cell wall biosynthesis
MMAKHDYTVIHLSTGHLGGAGLAARRLNSQLNAAGVDSRFYALGRSDFKPEQNEFSIKRTLVNRFLSAIFSFLELRLSTKVFFSPLSVNSIPKNFESGFKEKQKTILHIHNWFNLLNIKEISRLNKLGFPIVITLHDQRTMTGGCHYALKCDGFQFNCESCPLLKIGVNRLPKLMLKRSSKFLQRMDSRFALIAPSNWISMEAKKSTLLKEKMTIFIPNTLGVNTIQPSPDSASTHSAIRLGVASMDSRSYIKGGDITSGLSIEFRNQKLPFEITYLNDFPQNAAGTSEFWKSIDYLMVLSRAENSPNVIHEAKQSGIPVIASKIGGITELLDEDFDIGIDAIDLNVNGVLEILKRISAMNDPHKSAEHMRTRFSQYTERSIKDHILLYERLTQTL